MDTYDVFSFLARKGLTAAGSAMATHGFLCTAACTNGTSVEQFVGAGMTIAGVGWSWWRERGQALVTARFAELRNHVRNIPATAPNGPGTVPLSVTRAIETAKRAAAA